MTADIRMPAVSQTMNNTFLSNYSRLVTIYRPQNLLKANYYIFMRGAFLSI